MRVAVATAVLLAAIALGPTVCIGAGPWSAVVVDAYTGSPLEGAVVVARWRDRGTPYVVVAHEVVTDAQGRLTLPAREEPNPLLSPAMKGRDLLVFKAGYGGWRFRGDAEDLTAPGVVIEMRPLTTLDERLKYAHRRMAERDPRWGYLNEGDGPGYTHDVAFQQIRRYEAAINDERVLLGLPRVGLGRPHLGEE
jgi:hypothetical protein